MERNFVLILLAAGLFSWLAAMSAFLITYEEYKKHLLLKKRVVLISLKMGLITFLFFMFFMILFIWLAPHLSLFRP